jgi:hypothetical protein
MKQAVEMTAYGKPGKRYNRFPPFPQALGAAKLAANPAVKYLPVELAQLPL